MGQSRGIRVRKPTPKPGEIMCKACRHYVPYSQMCFIEKPRGQKGGMTHLQRCIECTFSLLKAWGIQGPEVKEKITKQSTTLF